MKIQISSKQCKGDPDNGGSVTYADIYTYDSNGNRISSKVYYGDPDNGGIVTGAGIYTYDSNGKLILMKEYLGDPDQGASVSDAYIYTYDANGNKTSYKHYYSGDPDNGGRLGWAETWTYDSDDKMTSHKSYNITIDGSGTLKNYTCNGSCSLTSTETFTAEQFASILAGFPTNYVAPIAKPKRTSYTLEEAAQHVNHSNENKIIFTFK